MQALIVVGLSTVALFSTSARAIHITMRTLNTTTSPRIRTTTSAMLTSTMTTTTMQSTIATTDAPFVAIVTESREEAMDRRIGVFLRHLPERIRRTPVAATEIGQMVGTLYYLRQGVQASRQGNTGKLALIRRMLGAASPRQVNLKLNMEEMLPLIMHFMDAQQHEPCSPMYAAGSSSNDTTSMTSAVDKEMTAMLGMMTQIIQSQQQSAAAADAAAAAAAAEESASADPFSQLFGAGGKGGNKDMKKWLMNLASKIVAETAANMITGAR